MGSQVSDNSSMRSKKAVRVSRITRLLGEGEGRSALHLLWRLALLHLFNHIDVVTNLSLYRNVTIVRKITSCSYLSFNA